jgi:undecaprenyl-diphosphatase
VLSIPFLVSLWLKAMPIWLDGIDRQLFMFINQQATHPILDAIVPWWRESLTWTPFYLFLLLSSAINFKKSCLPWIAMALVTILLSDQISSTLIKPLFERIRPCNDPSMQSGLRLLLDGCGAGYSFTSSHATNHFALAVYLTFTLRTWIGRYAWVLFLWAATIAYAQVYAGVHYPLDVLGGALLGSAIGYLTSRFFNNRIGGLTLQSTAS